MGIANRQFALIAGLVMFAWLISAGYVVLSSATLGSPDEAANAYFAAQLSNTGQLKSANLNLTTNQPTTGQLKSDNLNLTANQPTPSQLKSDNLNLTTDQLTYWHPRSTRVDGDTLKPGSFIGLPLIGGWLGRVLGSGAIKLLTPLGALFGLYALYRALRRFWSPWWALLGSSLVAVHPVWWQFQTLPYYHNGLFASLLLVAGWRLMVLWERHELKNAIWLGLAYGAALWFRPVEVIWTGPLIAIVLLAQKNWRNLFVAVGAAAVVQLPWLIVGWQLYGPSLGSGYSASQIGTVTSAADVFSPLPKIFTPPGGWNWHWLSSVWNYLIMLVPAWSMATIVAAVYYFRRIADRPLKILKIGLVLIFLIVPLVYYGTWDLYPLATPDEVGSLASYARYWLPLYVAMVVGVMWLLKRINGSRWLMALVIAGLFVSQIATIIWHPGAGILARLDQDRAQREKLAVVLELTPDKAAIVAGHMDKVLFPDRVVSFKLPQNEAQWQAFTGLAAIRPVYVYVTPNQYDLNRVNAQLQPRGFAVNQKYQVREDQLWAVAKI